MPSVSVIRPMRVTIDPAWPEPFEEVSATISGKTSDPYLTLNDSRVSCLGNDIEIELEWITFVPRTLDAFNGAQCCSTGYGVEQVRPTVSGATALKPWDVSVSLGSFDVGRYRIHVESRGALEGEAEASFEIRQGQSTLFSSPLPGSQAPLHSEFDWNDLKGWKSPEIDITARYETNMTIAP